MKWYLRLNIIGNSAKGFKTLHLKKQSHRTKLQNVINTHDGNGRQKNLFNHEFRYLTKH